MDNIIIIKDLDEFKKILDEEQDMILCYFTAKWCGPCKHIYPTVCELADKIKILKIDVDDCEEISTECDITCMPTFKFYLKNNCEHTFSGADKDELKNTVNNILNKNNLTFTDNF